MSIEATKSVTTIAGLLNRDVINEQQKSPRSSQQTENSLTSSANVTLSKNTLSLLQSTHNDIDMEKVDNIKQAITEGKLVINTTKIADELIKQMIENIE